MIIKNLFNDHNIPKKLQQGDFSMNDLKLHFTAIKRKKLMARYGKKMIITDYYSIVKFLDYEWNLK